MGKCGLRHYRRKWGKVPLGEVVEFGSLEYVEHFQSFLLDPKESGVHKTASCNGGSRALGDPVH